MKRIAQVVFILALAALLAGCNKPKTVTKAELDAAKALWQEPKVSTWYYCGSKSGYHYYIHRDLPGDVMYRISERDWNQEKTFPLTRDENKWRVMPWGVQALQRQTQPAPGQIR